MARTLVPGLCRYGPVLVRGGAGFKPAFTGWQPVVVHIDEVAVSRGPWKHRPKNEAKRIKAGIAAVEEATGRRVGGVKCPDGYVYIFDDGRGRDIPDLDEWDRRG